MGRDVRARREIIMRERVSRAYIIYNVYFSILQNSTVVNLFCYIAKNLQLIFGHLAVRIAFDFYVIVMFYLQKARVPKTLKSVFSLHGVTRGEQAQAANVPQKPARSPICDKVTRNARSALPSDELRF